MADTACVGPYRATRLWNDVVIAFRQYLPCGRHRRYMKTFDNCFSGASATEWLLQYLKTNGSFGSDISREKATSLLNKLYRAGIFEEVIVSKTMRHKQDAQENRLYKFSPISPSKMKMTRLPLAPRNDIGVNRPLPKLKPSQCKDDTPLTTKQKSDPEPDVPEKKQSKLMRKISLKRDKKENEDKGGDEENYTPCHLVTRVLTTKEIKDTWKAAFVLRCKQVLGVANLSDVIRTDLVHGYNVMHNCIYLNKSGVVTNIDVKDQLPHWVMSAMKCLARWPEPPEPGLPNYPGFEKDVFGVVKNYFLSQEQPLIPYSLYDIVTNVFVTAGNSQPRHSSPRSYNNESGIPSTLWSSASLENIILNLTKKYCLLDSTGNHGSTKDLQDSTSWFGTQEDLRFANHNSASYRQSVISNSTGMHEQIHAEANAVSDEQSYALTTQESCKSQHNTGSVPFLTTQSAMEASDEQTDKWLSGRSRKYGSVPNLKVSRYETAFGPDNRTVTRVFYQNGMTTDFGHDVEESSFLQRENNADRAKSAACLYAGDGQVEKDSCFTKKPVARSKSVADVKKYSKSVFSDEVASVRPRNVSARSSSFNGNNSFSRGQHKNNHSSPGNNSRQTYDADNRPGSSFQQSENHDTSCQQSLHVVYCDRLEAASSLQNTSASGIVPAAAPQDKHPRESQTVASCIDNVSSQCQSYPSQPRTSDVSTSYPHVNVDVPSSPTRKPSSVYGLECKYGAYSEEHIPSLEATKSPYPLPTLDLFQRQKLLCDPVPQRDMPSLTGGKYGRSHGSFDDKQETEYSVVLDASKKRSVLGWTNLASQYSSQSCVNLTTQHNAASCDEVQSAGTAAVANRMTSTPCLPPYGDTTASKDGYISSLSLSRITPFYSRNSHICNKDSQHSFMSYPQTRLAEDRAKNSLQMITLLLPPANRRKLHFLFKMMMKMTLNPNLCLDPSQTTRSLVIGTFCPAIIRSPESCELDEVVQLQLVSFMLDCYDDIFTPPSGIKTQVSDRLKALQRPQVVYSPKPERTVRFCQQTSVTDFENQRISTSHTALESLLEGIVSDQAMNIKEKSKKLKQFQKMYPTIYHSRFPDVESETKALMVKVKVKQSLIARPLNKLKGLRL